MDLTNFTRRANGTRLNIRILRDLFRGEWGESIWWQLVTNDLNGRVGIRPSDFKNLIRQVSIQIEFIERFGKEFKLQSKVHPDWTVEADQPGMQGYVCVLSF